MNRFFSRFFYILGNKKGQLLLLLLAILSASLFETIGIGLVGPFMSLVTNPDVVVSNSLLSKVYQLLNLQSTNQFIGVLGLVIISLFYLKSGLKFYLQRYIFRFGYQVQGELRFRLLKTYLELPYSFHLKQNTALLIQNIVEETRRFANGIVIATLNASVHLIVLFTLICLLVMTDALATIVILLVLLAVLLLYSFFKDKIALWGKNQSRSNTEIIRIINHALGGFKETRIIGCETYFLKQIEEQSQAYAKAMSSFMSFKIVPLIVVESLIITFLIGFTSLLLLLDRNTQNLIPILSIFALASIRIIPTVNQLTAAVTGIKNSTYSFNKLFYDLKELDKIGLSKASELVPEPQLKRIISPTTKTNKVNTWQREINLEQLSYTYPGSSELSLNNISLTLNQGDSIALIGKSGAGKTTLVDVILGLLTPGKGDIRVNGISIYENLRSWQNLVGYIPQSIFLIDDTIEKNIAFGVPEDLINQDKLNEAIQAAQLTELVEELPQGTKTQVGERGVRLSGGQRQRVGIARAIYHEREILVLDEATAALDNETEGLVTEAIQSLSGQKTMIIIAHRLTTVRHCDCIYVLDKGRIIKSGNYEEVVLSSQNKADLTIQQG